jgi:bacteriocin-like protein
MMTELNIDELDAVSGGEISLWGYLEAAYAAGAANAGPPMSFTPPGPGVPGCPGGRNGQHG